MVLPQSSQRSYQSTARHMVVEGWVGCECGEELCKAVVVCRFGWERKGMGEEKAAREGLLHDLCSGVRMLFF